MPDNLQRVHDKINYETNVVDPKTFCLLLRAVKDNQPLSYENGRDVIFPKTRAAAGMQWDPSNPDTHASNTLEQYGLVNATEDRHITVSDLGYRFLDCFSGNFEVKVSLDYYRTILLQMLIAWHISENGRNIHPGRMLLKLLTDSALGGYHTDREFALWTSNELITTDSDYEKLKSLIISSRETGNFIDTPNKKSEVFLRPFANSWGLFNREIKNGIYYFSVRPDVLPLVNQFFIIRTIKEENEVESQDEPASKPRKPRINPIHPLNQIIYGAPGTGKTYASIEYAVAIIENRPINLLPETIGDRQKLMQKFNSFISDGRITFTTFHQSFGYEEFIQGLRPNSSTESITFHNEDGIFKTIADKAMADSDNEYVIIIDEINRGNISKIFGELITLIEEDKRYGEINALTVKLPSGDKFSVPNNLYIIGTMNSADKSISMIDSALRRRFDFIEQAPNPELIKDEKLKAVLITLNVYLKRELRNTDLLIGHSYFIGKKITELANIMNRNVIPLLYEYFYDDESKVTKALECIGETSFKIDTEYKGRLRITSEE